MSSPTRAHPTPRTYWFVGLFLFIVTAVEIAVPYTDTFDGFRAPMLLTLGAVKFLVVVGVFMHLRYDLHSYRRLFFIGVIGALLIWGVVLATFQAL